MFFLSNTQHSFKSLRGICVDKYTSRGLLHAARVESGILKRSLF